ncbi:MAG: DUF1244 domain-containing protein [Pseudomonadota bacterium]
MTDQPASNAHGSSLSETEIEAAVFRRLRDHLRASTEVQNIDMMNLAGFCRNCLSRWYQEAVEEAGGSLDKAASREIVYGMPYETWRERYQTEASDAQKQVFEARGGGH